MKILPSMSKDHDMRDVLVEAGLSIRIRGKSVNEIQRILAAAHEATPSRLVDVAEGICLEAARVQKRAGYVAPLALEVAQVGIALQAEGCSGVRLQFLGTFDEGIGDGYAPSGSELERWKRRLGFIDQLKSRQRAGAEFERFINHLLACYGLQPKANIRLVGEQIDASFRLGGNTYLLECKCLTEPVPSRDLQVFHAKLANKPRSTRAVFWSATRYSAGASKWVRESGNQRLFFMLDRAHLNHVLEGKEALDAMLLRHERRFEETGNPYKAP
ncbi:MAG: restriction endonuclease [Deltaproteobacteria bacterium]|nr:restriction endonuclease [Deltaproteobacteria bacterium]